MAAGVAGAAGFAESHDPVAGCCGGLVSRHGASCGDAGVVDLAGDLRVHSGPARSQSLDRME